MSDLAATFDAFYSRLLLRDLFGKVIPGSVVLWAVASAYSPPGTVVPFFNSLSFLPSLVLLGCGWIVAFGIQAFGESARMIKYHNFATNEAFYLKRKAFHDSSGDLEHQQLERLAVIKEACGNGYVALLISGLIYAADLFVDAGCVGAAKNISANWHIYLSGGLAIVFLARMHFVHVARQTVYMEAILSSRREEQA